MEWTYCNIQYVTKYTGRVTVPSLVLWWSWTPGSLRAFKNYLALLHAGMLHGHTLYFIITITSAKGYHLFAHVETNRVNAQPMGTAGVMVRAGCRTEMCPWPCCHAYIAKSRFSFHWPQKYVHVKTFLLGWISIPYPNIVPRNWKMEVKAH